MKSVMTGSRRRQQRDVVLPDDACPECGTMMGKVNGALEMPVHGEEITVPSVSHRRCPRCDERMLDLEEARDFRERALLIYRKKHGLLSAQELRAIRERLGLSQQALARLLHLGVASISRWEAGRNAQTASMDILLRLLRDVPATLTYLRKNAA